MNKAIHEVNTNFNKSKHKIEWHKTHLDHGKTPSSSKAHLQKNAEHPYHSTMYLKFPKHI